MELLFVTSEITPYSRSSEIGDVCAALPKALRGGGHKVTVISPLWPGVDATARGLARRLSGVEVTVGAERFACTLHDGRTTGGVDLIFVGHTDAFAGGIGASDARAALVFVQAAMQVAAAREPKPDVVHAHGWFAAGALPLASAALPSAARVLSLYDPGVEGDTGGLELPEAIAAAAGGGRSLLAAGAAAAQRVVAGSNAGREELLALGSELARGLAATEGKLLAIPDALDAARWNPLTDPLIPARFDPVDLRGKARCKDALQLELALPIEPDLPLVVSVGSLSREAGGELLAAALPALLRSDLQLVIAGNDAALEQTVRERVPRAEEKLRGVFPADERAAHRAIAAADLLLIPGRDPSYPELHLSGQRYGALPVARRIGAIADGVVDCDAQLLTGTGFLFESAEPDELVATVQRALAAFSQRRAFDGLRSRCMKLDLSWERSARRYEHVYKTLKGSQQG